MTHTDVRRTVFQALDDTKITDMHTHIYSPPFGSLLLWGIDELLTYHYLVAETMRWIDMPYETFWTLSKREQADLIWKTLFIDHSPYSESCRGVLTALKELGLDTSSRDLEAYRAYFREFSPQEYVDKVLQVSNVKDLVMTNDPFDDVERPVWESGEKIDPRFHAALRLDSLLNSWDTAVPRLKEWGYAVDSELSREALSEVRRFLSEWIDKMDALYMAISLPPTFAFPEDSPRGRLIAECVLPVSREKNAPFAMMIGVKKLINPALRLAGDGVGKGDITALEHLCANYPDNKFLVTYLARENMHELAVTARKFRNLMVFGCWWFLNNPSLVDEITRMRSELLGVSFIPQHSDSRVLDQLIYKWSHFRQVIGGVLTDKYIDLTGTGWKISEDEIRRDISDMLSDNFWRFVKG